MSEVLQQQAPPGSHVVVIHRGHTGTSSASKAGKDAATHAMQQQPELNGHQRSASGAGLLCTTQGRQQNSVAVAPAAAAAACNGDQLPSAAGTLQNAAASQQQQQQQEGYRDISTGLTPQGCSAEVLEAPGGVGLQVLLAAGLQQAQALLIGSSPELKHEEADAEVGVLCVG
jgi:hypothetical protein